MQNNQLEKEELEKRYQSIVENAVDGIITINSLGEIETVNPAACRLFGYSEAEMLGQNVNSLMPSPHRENHDEYIKRYQNTGVKKIIGIGREVQGYRKDGSLFPFWLSVSELQLGDKTIFTGIIHDMSDRKKAEEALKNSHADLEKKVLERTGQLEEALAREKELGELKSRFVSMASHEFRTPLATIQSSASLVRRYVGASRGNPERQLYHLEKIRSTVNNLTSILEDFLSLTKLEEGRVEKHPERFELNTFCRETIEEIRGLAKQGQDIVMQHDKCDENIYVTLDRRLVKNILYNLLSNAIKYSEKDIVVACKVTSERLILQVIDQGVGIPEQEQQHVFERFFRASNVTNIQGVGLGMNIVKRYLDILGGHIELKSVHGEGTTFTIFLPL